MWFKFIQDFNGVSSGFLKLSFRYTRMLQMAMVLVLIFTAGGAPPHGPPCGLRLV